MTENEIIGRILDGDRNLFKDLVEHHQAMVFRTCMGFLHQKDDAEDLTQEIFVQAYLSLKNFKAESSFSTWIYRIAVNACLNKTRKSIKNSFLQKVENIFSSGNAALLPDNSNPEEIIIQKESNAFVQKALDSLPENQRIAIVLSKYDDLSQKEIAAIMNISEGAVEALIQRAKAKLRENFSSFSKKNSKSA